MKKILFVLMSLYASFSVFGQKTEEIGGHKAVDLGLSVKWATCNVGADKPMEYGSYFAWGEVNTKKIYDWKTYAHCSGDAKKLTRYCLLPAYGDVDGKNELGSADDAATANWGAEWRIPTMNEFSELMKKCQVKWMSNYRQSGIPGYKITAKNGNFIFLPAAGFYRIQKAEEVGVRGYYATTTLHDKANDNAYSVILDAKRLEGSFDNRCFGLSVRPVTAK